MWLIENWRLVWMIVVAGGIVVAGVPARRNPDRHTSRIVFTLFPAFNPDVQRRQVTPLSMWLVGLGLLIVALAAALVPGSH
ncbi:MAG: hypothetical protein U1F41_13725 [Burkholderiales bacterium]